ncbi:hypothetical protein TNCV_1762871 [Trichonephila clavipes]|nr:hypothetical protein TNCV_1762871 [Trichonephila clavipes]
MFIIRIRHHSLTSETQIQGIIADIAQSCYCVGPSLANINGRMIVLSDALKQIQCAGEVSCIDNNTYYEILHCNYQHLMHKWFQVVSEEEI